jgi:hypothetical protein
MGQAAFEFWSYKESAGDAPTTAALALQLYALDVYDRWLGLLSSTLAILAAVRIRCRSRRPARR